MWVEAEGGGGDGGGGGGGVTAAAAGTEEAATAEAMAAAAMEEVGTGGGDGGGGDGGGDGGRPLTSSAQAHGVQLIVLVALVVETGEPDRRRAARAGALIARLPRPHALLVVAAAAVTRTATSAAYMAAEHRGVGARASA